MFFFASKLFWLIASPLNACILGALVGIALLRWRPALARVTILACVACLALMTFSPAGNLLLRPLEERFPTPPADMPAPYGILVLGGAIDGDLSAKHDQVVLEEGGSRITQAALLARRYPNARVFYTGGSPWANGGDSVEARQARDLLIGLGVTSQRVGIEERSRNTYENARYSADILKPQPDQVWLLVTSAFHMPRSMGLFRKAGFNVVAYPTDFHTFFDARDDEALLFRVTELSLCDLAIHEWIGLTAYYASGKIPQWFPGP